MKLSKEEIQNRKEEIQNRKEEIQKRLDLIKKKRRMEKFFNEIINFLNKKKNILIYLDGFNLLEFLSYLNNNGIKNYNNLYILERNNQFSLVKSLYHNLPINFIDFDDNISIKEIENNLNKIFNDTMHFDYAIQNLLYSTKCGQEFHLHFVEVDSLSEVREKLINVIKKK